MTIKITYKILSSNRYSFSTMTNDDISSITYMIKEHKINLSISSRGKNEIILSANWFKSYKRYNIK